MRVIVTNKDRFEACVFGGWCMLQHLPHIATEGVEVILVSDMYYLTKDGKNPIDTKSFTTSTYFLTSKEVDGTCGCELVY